MRSAKDQSGFNRAQYAHLYAPPTDKSICRILMDQECAVIRGDGEYPFLWRFYGAKEGYPMTVVLHGGSGFVHLKQWWQDYFVERNRQAPDALKFVKGRGAHPNTGWVNAQPWPTVRQIACAGDGLNQSYVVVDKVVGDRAYVQSYYNTIHPSEYKTEYLHPFGVGYPDDTVGAAKCGLLYTFPIANTGERLWMNIWDLTYLRPVAADVISGVMEMAA